MDVPISVLTCRIASLVRKFFDETICTSGCYDLCIRIDVPFDSLLTNNFLMTHFVGRGAHQGDLLPAEKGLINFETHVAHDLSSNIFARISWRVSRVTIPSNIAFLRDVRW